MVRTYKKKTNRAMIVEKDVEDAIQAVMKNNMSIRNAAESFGLKPTMLYKRVFQARRYLNKVGPLGMPDKFSNKYASRQVFTVEQETLLEKYLMKSSKLQYGLTYKAAREMAYSYAKYLGRSFPESWERDKTAGLDWIKGFMKRHSTLSLRKPENTSLNRALGFNKASVQAFFDNYESLLKKFNFSSSAIYNCDETGITTVLEAPKVIAVCGEKQVGQNVSGERGELVSFCGIVNAMGNTVPPVFVFPRKRYKDIFLNGAPSESLGLVSQTGWMTADIFLEVVKHFQKYSRCTAANPVLLLLDNHESHISLDIILFCRENGIVLLTFPPHCSHRLQPLDVGVYGPFKYALKTSFNDWLTLHPGKRITIYEIGQCSSPAFTAAFTSKNIKSGFSKPGIWPLSRLAFTDDDFITTQTTSLMPVNPEDASTSCNAHSIQDDQINIGASTSNTFASSPTPECVRPLPRIEFQDSTLGKRKKRQKGKSRILTDTPEKDIVVKAMEEKAEKMKIKCERVAKKRKLELAKLLKKEQSKVVVSDSESDISFEESSHQEICAEVNLAPENLAVNDFVLVEFTTKKTKIHYVGRIEKMESDEANVKFMRKQKNETFVFPETDDTSMVNTDDILLKLPPPTILGCTYRAASSVSFSVKLEGYNVR